MIKILYLEDIARKPCHPVIFDLLMYLRVNKHLFSESVIPIVVFFVLFSLYLAYFTIIFIGIQHCPAMDFVFIYIL